MNDFGDTTTGFLFGTTGTSGTPRSALDVDTSGAPLAYLQRVTPGCVTGAPAASPASAGPSLRRLQLWAASTR